MVMFHHIEQKIADTFIFPKLSKIIAFLISFFGLYAISVFLFSNNASDYDLWGYLSFGRIIWEDGYFPFHDIFSYTPGKPLWVYHEWLTGVMFYIIYKYSGTAGLQLLRYTILVLNIYFIYKASLKKGGNSFLSLIVLVPAVYIISYGYIPVRAQIFTGIFFTLTLYIITIAVKDQKWLVLWWLIPIQIFWCNFHGGFVAGLGLIALYAVGEGVSGRKVFPFLKIGLLASFATLINPYGFEYWKYIISAISMPRPEIDEWMSVIKAYHYGVYLPIIGIFTFLSLTLLLSAIFRIREHFTDFVIIAIIICLGFAHVRHIFLFGFVLGIFLPPILSEYWKARRGFFFNSIWIRNILLVIFWLSAYLLINPSLSLQLVPTFEVAVSPSRFPIGALLWMKDNNIRGNILPNFSWGEFITWHCHPDCKVAMDGRYETVFRDDVSIEYFDFLMGRESGKIFLRKYPHDIVLVKPHTRVSEMMRKDSSWQVAFSDQWSVLFIKKRKIE